MDYLYGVLGLSFWGYVAVALVTVHITIMGVTLYLHRDQAHRGLDLHPVIRHFFRFWVWMNTGIITKEWVAVHRKHHARCETPEDPHSPKNVGLRKVVLEGSELYQDEARNRDTQEQFGRGTPDDWVERNLYSRFRNLGLILLVVLDLVLFGVPGIILIAVQMVAIPFLAAGIINGVGHHTGYRNYDTPDASTNIVPWGVVCGGEELHNNHHAFPSSARFSMRPWEFDIGWFYVRIWSALGLAKVKKVAPRARVVPGERQIDLDTLRAVIVARMHVLRDYRRKVTLPVLKNELRRATNGGDALLRKAKRLLNRPAVLLDDRARAGLREVLERNQKLKTVHEFRERLQTLWSGAAVNNERLLAQLREWCTQAEASGIKVLQDFAHALRGYTLQQVT